MLQRPLFTDTAGGILSTQVYRKSLLRSFRRYFYAQKYSLNKDVLCAWLNAGDKMVSKKIGFCLPGVDSTVDFFPLVSFFGPYRQYSLY